MSSRPFHSVANWQHSHEFFHHNVDGERSTRVVLILTLITMVAEISAGTLYGSMALLADGWHMGTHSAAFLITLFAYRYARRHKDNPAFAFGTGKVGFLGGFASAVALGLVAIIMAGESIMRLISPTDIVFDQAILVAGIGLAVNLVSALLLKDHHHHGGHGHTHHHEEAHHHRHASQHEHRDHNLRAAYLHVVADALTSVLAIAALLAGKYLGLNWLDPLIGLLGAAIIARWALGLIKDTGPVLLDASDSQEEHSHVETLVASVPDHAIADLHIWRISDHHKACILALVSHEPKDGDYFADRLRDELGFHHVTVQIHRCACIPEHQSLQV